MESRLFLNQDKVPSITPRNYYTREFLFRVLLFSPIILIKSFFVVFFMISAWINCATYNYFFSNNRWIFNFYFYPMFQVIQRMILFSAGFLYIKTRDDCINKERAGIYVTNHLGIMDYVIFFSQMRGRPMAKKEFYTIPFISTFAVFCRYIPVDRSNKEKRQASFNKLDELVKGLDTGDGFSIFLCPEMCITSGESLLNFATGAFRFKQTINPLVVKFAGTYENKVLRADESSLFSIIDLFSCWKLDCEVHYMREYEPSLEECSDVRLFTDNVRNKMAENMGVRTTDYIYADVLIYFTSYVVNKKTNKCESLFYDGYIDFKRLDEVFKVGDYKKIVKLVKEFKKELKQNGNTFLLSGSERNLRRKVSTKGTEKGLKLTDYIIKMLER